MWKKVNNMPNLYDYESYLSPKQIPKLRIPRKRISRIDITRNSKTFKDKTDCDR